MSVSAANINTAGAVVTIGGVIPLATNPDADGYYWGSVSGTDVGCTTGGVKVSYSYEKQDIFCDQVLSAVEAAIVSESAEISFEMLETNAAKLKLALHNATYTASVSEAKIGMGGLRTMTYVLMKLEVADNDTGLLTTWTFYKVLPGSFEINFERANPTKVGVKFTAYADSTHAAGHQLFSIREALT